MSSHSVKLSKALRDLARIKNSFGYVANTSPDAYSLGLFNGIEVAMAIMQDREPRLEGENSSELVRFIGFETEINKDTL